MSTGLSAGEDAENAPVEALIIDAPSVKALAPLEAGY